MKKLEEIAESETEKEVLNNLVKDIRSFTTDSLKVLKFFESQKKSNSNSNKLSFEEFQTNVDLQKKVYDEMYDLFQRMHRIVDFPSFVIFEDELNKQYQK